jgi:hypothetical protein
MRLFQGKRSLTPRGFSGKMKGARVETRVIEAHIWCNADFDEDDPCA